LAYFYAGLFFILKPTRNEEHPLDEKPNALGFPSSEQKSADLNL
jgi:hypothetical protein